MTPRTHARNNLDQFLRHIPWRAPRLPEALLPTSKHMHDVHLNQWYVQDTMKQVTHIPTVEKREINNIKQNNINPYFFCDFFSKNYFFILKEKYCNALYFSSR